MTSFFKPPKSEPVTPAMALRAMIQNGLVYPYYLPAVLEAIRALEAEQARGVIHPAMK